MPSCTVRDRKHLRKCRCVAAALMMAASGLLGGDLAAADEGDPVRQRLDKACVAFAKTKEDVAALILQHLDKQEDVVRKSGDKDAVDRIKAERTAFEERGQWPVSTPVGLQRRHASAVNAVRAEYARAIKSYTQDKEDAKAEAAERELREFLADHHPFFFEGPWHVRHSTGWTAVRTVRGIDVVDRGPPAKWTRDKGTIIVKFPGGGIEWLEIDFENPDELRGKNERGTVCVWTRKKK